MIRECSRVEREGARGWEALAERVQAGEVAVAEARGPLHLDRDQPALAVEDEVDLDSRRRPPIRDLVVELGVVVGGAQLLEDECLERGSVDLVRSVERSAR